MTLHTDSTLMSAQHIQNDPRPAGRSRGEGVKAVNPFTRRADRKRAWDELSEIDRAVLLESVRQRREAREHQRRAEAEIYRSRTIR